MIEHKHPCCFCETKAGVYIKKEAVFIEYYDSNGNELNAGVSEVKMGGAVMCANCDRQLGTQSSSDNSIWWSARERMAAHDLGTYSELVQVK